MANSSGVGISIDGGRQVRAAMKRAGLDLEILDTAHRAAEGIVMARAAELAPRKTGRLAENLRGSSAKTYAAVRVGGKRLPYAGPVHWGWGQSSPVKGSFGGDRFLTTAVAETEPVWAPMYLKAVQDACDRVNRVKG